jgi:hypothetical protein
MKERGILFSGPMVRQILAGNKSMTRRVIDRPERFSNIREAIREYDYLCPHGKVGDRLYVKETFAVSTGRTARYKKGVYLYRAEHGYGCSGQEYDLTLWKPSLFMPRKASRITLEITNVRVEWLQEITNVDIIAEGAVLRYHNDQFGNNPVSAFDGKVYIGVRDVWIAGWDKINGKKAPFASNPPVWVIQFKVHEIAEGWR